MEIEWDAPQHGDVTISPPFDAQRTIRQIPGERIVVVGILVARKHADCARLTIERIDAKPSS
jgi:hypothetical protein